MQTFIDGTIDAFFRAIGHIHSDPATIDRLFGDGLFGSIIKGIGDVLSFGVNLAIDAAHTIVVGGVRVATSLIDVEYHGNRRNDCGRQSDRTWIAAMDGDTRGIARPHRQGSGSQR